MSLPSQPKRKINFAQTTQNQPAALPIQSWQRFQQQGGQGVQQQSNTVVPLNVQNPQQQFQVQQPTIQQENNLQQQMIPPPRVFSSGNNQNPPFNNSNSNPQPVAPQQIQIQQNFNKIEQEQPRQKEINKPENWIQALPNTSLEERELKFQSKNRLETSKFFKGYIESTKNSSKQSCIMDLTQQIANTKAFFLKQQPLAIKIQEFMEKLLFFFENQKQASFGKFLEKNYIQKEQVNLPSTLFQQLRDNNQQPKDISLSLTYPPSNEDMAFLQNIQNLASFLEQSKTLDLLAKSSTYDQLSSLSKFVYLHFVQKVPCCLTVEDSDFYLFSSCEGSPNDNILLQLLLQTLKHEEKLLEMISQSEKNYLNDKQQFKFKEIEQFIQDLQKSKNLTIKVQLLIRNPPNANQKLSEKYSELWDLYGKGCKSQIFKKIIESSWHEKSFQQGFEQTFGMVVQFQLFIIWMQQMQEKIMDFQLFARACISPGNLQDSRREMSANLSRYIGQFKADLQSLIFRQIASKVYCVAAALTNKDISKQTKSVFQIFFSRDEQSQLLLGNIVCQKTNSSLCFYFRDQYDNHWFKYVSVCFVNGRGNVAAQLNCEANFLVDTKVDRQYQFCVSDNKDFIKKYSEFGRFYDTVLINKLIDKTRLPRNTQTSFDLYELLFPK